MYMRVYAFTYMRIWVDSHRVETKREGMVRMAPFISENIDLVPCMAMAFNAAIATMGFLKMVAWTEHGMSSRMSRYIDRFGKMGIDREIWRSMRDRISTSRATRSSAGSLASPSLWLWGLSSGPTTSAR